MIKNRPNPNEAFPNPNIPSLCFIKNVVKSPRIIIGDYTYYDDVDGADQFEKHVTHFYDFIGDRLIIGKFCAIAKGVEFVMNGANHRMDGVTTYPFYVIGGDWGSAIAPVKDELPLKGDTIVGNDVWIGQHVTCPYWRRSHYRCQLGGGLGHSSIRCRCGKSLPRGQKAF